jgi:hypothetical protein
MRNWDFRWFSYRWYTEKKVGLGTLLKFVEPNQPLVNVNFVVSIYKLAACAMIIVKLEL